MPLYCPLDKRERGYGDAERMSSPPTGTVTFLFTDIEGSTKMWERDARRMEAALARHDDLLREAVESHGGYVFKTVGDAFCCAFPTATNTLEATLASQRSLFGEGWEEGFTVKARMALHTGTVEERGGDYFGPPVNRVARLLSAGHGGQTLVSLTTQELVRDDLPSGTSLKHPPTIMPRTSGVRGRHSPILAKHQEVRSVDNSLTTTDANIRGMRDLESGSFKRISERRRTTAKRSHRPP
jgi:class 3 adenylate cyclase